jgi:hypothetical protein
MTQIRITIHDFDMGLTEIQLGCAEDGPEKAVSCSVLALCRALIGKVNRIVMDETLKWDDEFRKAIQKVDESAKKETAGEHENKARPVNE